MRILITGAAGAVGTGRERDERPIFAVGLTDQTLKMRLSGMSLTSTLC